MKTIRATLVIRNGQELRLVKSRNMPLAPNEVGVEIIINCPQPPRIVGTVTIDLPEPPPATAEAMAVQYPEEYHNDGPVQRSGLSGSEEAGEQGSEVTSPS